MKTENLAVVTAFTFTQFHLFCRKMIMDNFTEVLTFLFVLGAPKSTEKHTVSALHK